MKIVLTKKAKRALKRARAVKLAVTALDTSAPGGKSAKKSVTLRK